MLLDKRIPLTYIFNKIKVDLLFVIVVGLVIHYFASTFSSILPDMPLTVAALLGTSISILLSFKMNQSYERWWEARKVWGAIVNDSRSLVLQLQSLVKDQSKVCDEISYRQIAWSYSLGNSLRGQDALLITKPWLSEADFNHIASHDNKPLALLQLHVQDLKLLRDSGKVDPYSMVQIDETIVRLTASMGMAERINNTVFPVTYRLFLHFTIYLFVIVFSIALKNIDTFYEIPLLAFVSSAFFLVEKTAYYLQDPFRNRPSDIAVTNIAQTIELNIRQLLGDREAARPVTKETFYLM
ncbi:bestrophin family protein [Pollutibacter soli]|uniref:bestrophin family protein n=1 Tax=Pollutibacter soli TaxID=3034157 RepID=UPI0030133F67